jgi:probable DNA metabolism protein
MIRYVYDGSFEGFLCAISAALREEGGETRTAEGLLREVTLSTMDADDQDLFSITRTVVTDLAVAAACAIRIRSIIGGDGLDELLFTHASDDPSVPRLLSYYVARTLAAGEALRNDIADPMILAMRRLQDRVSKEINKLMGFVRFKKVAGASLQDGIYYAAVSPDCNVVGFLGPHFSDRFPDMAFIIHDIRRGLAYRHGLSGESGMILLPDLPPELEASLAADSELLIPALWKEYFRRIAIAERRNPALQAKNMPRRYWRHMTELEDRLAGVEAPPDK